MGAKQRKPRKHPAKEARVSQAIYDAEVKAMKEALGPLVESPKSKK